MKIVDKFIVNWVNKTQYKKVYNEKILTNEANSCLDSNKQLININFKQANLY